MTKNVGSIDRILRVVIGIALLAGFFMIADGANRWVYLIGIIPLVTGIVGSCGLYKVFGFSTCPMKK